MILTFRVIIATFNKGHYLKSNARLNTDGVSIGFSVKLLHMKKFLLLSALVAMFSLTSCDDGDDVGPALSNEIGEWELDGLAFVNLPQTHVVQNEGRQVDLTFRFGAAAQNYFLKINQDNTYSITLEQVGIDGEVEGKWMIDKADDDDDPDILTLSPDGSTQDLTYDIVKNEKDKLEFYERVPVNLIPDIVYDTFPGGTDSLFKLADTVIFNNYTTTVQLDLLYVLKRRSKDN